MLLFPLSYFPADIPLIVFNRPSKTTQVRILNFDLINLRIFLVGSCHSAVLPLHDVLLISVLKCPCICIDLPSIHFRRLSLLFAQSWTNNWYNFTTGMSFLRELLSSTPPLMYLFYISLKRS